MIDQKLVQQDLSRKSQTGFGNIHFGNMADGEYNKSLAKYNQQFEYEYGKAISFLLAMQETLGDIYDMYGSNKSVRIASNAKSAETRIKQAIRLVSDSLKEWKKR